METKNSFASSASLLTVYLGTQQSNVNLEDKDPIKNVASSLLTQNKKKLKISPGMLLKVTTARDVTAVIILIHVT